MNQQKAIQILNAVAGLESGMDGNFSHKGISLGYIGNIENGNDFRSWGFFFPTLRTNKHNMVGSYESETALIEAFDSNPARFIGWAK